MELVVLVDEENREIGTAPKDTVHTKTTPRHRGISLFVFNSQGDLLLTRRAKTKKTFPGVWTNTVCGHPVPGESNIDAAKRRLQDELGIVADVKEVSPYQYRFTDKNGIVENEVCPILVCYSDASPKPNEEEVSDWRWISWHDVLIDQQNHPGRYSPWSIEEAQILVEKGI